MNQFYRTIIFILCMGLASAAPPALDIGYADMLQTLDAIAENLSASADQLEGLKAKMADMAMASTNYDEQKNIYLAAVLTVSTVAAICSYESELLTLFTDLRPKNRQYYLDVRQQSLQASIQQLQIMHSQMKINEKLLNLTGKEKNIFEKAPRVTMAAVDLLNQADSLVADFRSR